MGLIKRQYRCRECHSWLRRDEGTGFMFWWTCHRCKSALAAEQRQTQAAPAPTRSPPPAGWFRDPDNLDRERWWDGAEWSDHRR